MNAPSTISVYYDGTCPLCLAEVETLKKCDRYGVLIFTDCSVENFSDEHTQTANIDRSALMSALHIRLPDNTWQSGPIAFATIYRAIGLPLMANLWGCSLTLPITSILYRWFAKHRQFMSALGFQKAITLIIEGYARRAHQRSKICHDATCSRV